MTTIKGSSVGRGLVLCFAGILAVTALGSSEPAPRAPRTGTGTLRGIVIVGSEISSKRARVRLYPGADLGVAAASPAPAPNEAQNVVVYVDSTGMGGTNPGVRRGSPLIRQVNETFVPHVLPVLRGETVTFRNDDRVFHNVFSLSSAQSFDLGRYPSPHSKSVRMDRVGIVKVFCHIHSDMSAVILVRDNPFFDVPDERGRFEIEGLPAGEYRIVAWHERAHPRTKRVRIAPGKVTDVTFQVPLRDGEERD